MTANVSIQATLNNSANFFVISWAAASSPGTIISSIAPTKPYGNPFSVAIPNLTDQVYIITLWESASSSPAGTVRNATQIQPSSNTTTLRADDYLTVDVTSGLVSGTTSYVNTSYVGWTYDVEHVGLGTMFLQGAPNVNDPDYAQSNTGGFNLVRTGDTFQPGDKYVVHFQPQVAPSQSASVGSFSTGQIISSPSGTSLTVANCGMGLMLQGSGSVVPITLPPLSSLSDFQFLYIFSRGGSHISAPLTCQGTDKIQWKTQLSQLILCQCEDLILFKYNGLYQVQMATPTIFMTGEIVDKYGQGDFPYVLANGQLLSRTTYARLWNYFNSGAIDSNAIVSESQWNGTTAVYNGTTYYTKKGCWTPGDGSTNFRVPLLTSMFRRGANGSSRLIGSLEPNSVGQVTADINGQMVKKGGNSNSIVTIGTTPSGTTPAPDPVFGYYQATTPIIISGREPVSGGVGGTRPDNIAIYPCIRM